MCCFAAFQMKDISITSRLKRSLHLGRGLRLVRDSAPGWTAASLALIVIQGVLPLPVLYIVKLVVDMVASSLSSSGASGSFGQVVPLICLAGAIALVAAVCRSLGSLVSEARAGP